MSTWDEICEGFANESYRFPDVILSEFMRAAKAAVTKTSGVLARIDDLRVEQLYEQLLSFYTAKNGRELETLLFATRKAPTAPDRDVDSQRLSYLRTSLRNKGIKLMDGVHPLEELVETHLERIRRDGLLNRPPIRKIQIADAVWHVHEFHYRTIPEDELWRTPTDRELRLAALRARAISRGEKAKGSRDKKGSRDYSRKGSALVYSPTAREALMAAIGLELRHGFKANHLRRVLRLLLAGLEWIPNEWEISQEGFWIPLDPFGEASRAIEDRSIELEIAREAVEVLDVVDKRLVMLIMAQAKKADIASMLGISQKTLRNREKRLVSSIAPILEDLGDAGLNRVANIIGMLLAADTEPSSLEVRNGDS